MYGTGGYMLSVSEALSQQDAIGIGRKGTIDNPYILKAPFWTVDTLFYCVPKECDINFVYALYQTINWRSMDESTGVPSLSKTAINDVDVYVPVIEEQHRIGDAFSRIDNLITLHQGKHFQDYSRRFTTKNISITAWFTVTWEQRKLSDIYQDIGNAFVGTATPYYVDDGHFYLESNNIKDGQVNHNTEVFINDDFYEKQKDKWLRTGDMVMVQSGHVGHAAVIPEELDKSAAHALIMFRNPKVNIDPYFLNYQYQTFKVKKKIENITTGNTIKHILASDMQEFIVDITSHEEQSRIAGLFRGLDSLITLHQGKHFQNHNVVFEAEIIFG